MQTNKQAAAKTLGCSNCQLCGSKSKLLRSHLLPKFVFRWIKQTSATGKLRQAINVERRLQDGLKEPSYCANCEKLFSKHETYFSKEVFYPYVAGEKKVFVYDEWMKKFIIGLAFRVLQRDFRGFLGEYPNWSSVLLGVKNSWKDYLLGGKSDIDEEAHLFLGGEIEEVHGFDYSQVEWYFCRGTDATIVHGENELFIYVLFPKIIFVVSIYPKVLGGWSGTKIRNEGAITCPQSFNHPGFDKFLQSRLDIISKNPLSKRDQDKVMEEITSNWSRVKDSETIKLVKRIMERKNANSSEQDSRPRHED